MVWACVCGSGAYSLTGSLVVVSCIRCVSGGFEVLCSHECGHPSRVTRPAELGPGGSGSAGSVHLL